MKDDFFSKYISRDKTFHITEGSLVKVKGKQNYYETIFTVGNGFIGSRGIMEENPIHSNPGTFIAGIFDRSAMQVEELVNLPNPINLIIAAEGEKFDIETMRVLSHKRILDMKNGVLLRKTLFMDAKKRKFLYRSVRFFSMDQPHIGAMKVSLKLIKGTANLVVVDCLDDSVYNKGGLMLSRRRHFDTVKADKDGPLNYTAFSTHSYKNIIAYGESLTAEFGNKKFSVADRIHNFELKTGYEITFTKIFSIYTSYDYSLKSIKQQTMRLLKESVKKGFDVVFKEHIKAFTRRWDISDVQISGDYEIQKAVRFNIYHILIAVRKDYAHFSIGAKTLSGEGYRGHIFWDTEIYLLPFFIYTDPAIARNMIVFRYNTISQAKEIALAKGFKGAMYPWETTVRGTEQTPRYAKDVDGSIVEVRTQDFEHHITGDVAFSVYNYYRATGDKKFIIEYGTEIIFETARFWASRVEYDSGDKKYHIRNVIGPDEFHVDVDDNAFTNYIAKWNISYAVSLWTELRNTAEIKRMNFKRGEVDSWRDIAENIIIPYSPSLGIIVQFDGYLRKKDIKICEYDKNFIPKAPKHLEFTGLGRSRLLKQADVLLLFCLFGDKFSLSEKLKNYSYYITRTIHQSSLSYSMHALIASCLGDFFRAHVFFRAAINMDLNDVALNTVDGIHTASLGGVWQSLIFGYGGVGYDEHGLKINPRLPGNFKSIQFKFYYKGDLYEVEESNESVRLRFVPGNNKITKSKKKMSVFGKVHHLTPYRYRIIKNEGGKFKMVTAKNIIKKENLITVSKNTSVKKVGEIIIDKKVSSVPVVDSNKNLIGIISEKNIIKSTSEKKFSRLKAKDIMETKVIWVNLNDSLEKITGIFTKHPFRRLPVVKDKKVVGIITRRDIIADFLGGYY